MLLCGFSWDGPPASSPHASGPTTAHGGSRSGGRDERRAQRAVSRPARVHAQLARACQGQGEGHERHGWLGLGAQLPTRTPRRRRRGPYPHAARRLRGGPEARTGVLEVSTKSKAKGTAAEREVVNYLQQWWPTAERRALSGNKDKGDVPGISGVVVEIKAAERPLLASWKAETLNEQANAGATACMLVVKRK